MAADRIELDGDRRDAAAAVGEALRAGGFPHQEDAPLVSLLHRGATVPREALDAALVEHLGAAGVARAEGDAVVPLVRVEVWEDLLIAHDAAATSDLDADVVVGVNPSTRTTAALTPRRPVARALDMGTGTGALALRMAAHAGAVVGTDVNPRATDLAALNAAMNGIDLDLRVGDLFEPIEDGETFDLVVANLPFAVSPDVEFAFRDGSRPQDGTARDTIVDSARLLAPGGVSLVLCDWLIPDGDDPWARPAGWVADLGHQALLVHAGIAEPEAYAHFWNEYRFATDPAGYVAAIERWTAAFEAWEVAGVAHGFVVLRNDPAARGAVHRLAAAGGPSGDGGLHVTRLLANLAWLADHGDPGDLLAARPRLVEGSVLHQTMRYHGGWSADASTMALADSAGVTGDIHPLSTTVVLRLDGSVSVGDLVAAMAGQTSIGADALADIVLPSVRNLLEAGCLDLT